jgi:DNA-binding IclR family transcriptional regulator
MPTRLRRPARALDRLTPVDRAAVILTALARGAALPDAEIARLTGLRAGSVYRFMARLSLHAPIYQERGRWRWCDGAETND